MFFPAAIGILGIFATGNSTSGSCATVSGDRCDADNAAGECGCDLRCLARKDCCSDFSTVCVGACPANSVDLFACRDGTECDAMTHPDGYGCCGDHGGKLKCPSSLPYMCSGINGGTSLPSSSVLCGDDHCCYRSPHMCFHPMVDRTLLQDCPTLVSEGKPSICPYNHGPQQLMPNVTNFIGSFVHRQFLFAPASMETREDGKLVPGLAEWPFCTPHDEASKLLCQNGQQCDVLADGWDCCAEMGGRLRCPAEFPVMCEQKTCGGDDYCCGASAFTCGEGPLIDCPTTNSTVGTPSEEVRQCSANAPVLCTDNTCAVTKFDCADGIQTECPEVPMCEASEEWESTAVGGTAYAPCGAHANGTTRVGRKYRACISKFESGNEVAQWGRIMDGDHICRPAQPKCSNVTTSSGERVPYLPVGAFLPVRKGDCPNDSEGVSFYHCVLCPATNETKHEILSVCELPCDRELYCSDHGEAVSAVQDLSLEQGESCHCACDAGWTGRFCDVEAPTSTSRGVEAPISTSRGVKRYKHWSSRMLVVLTMLFVSFGLLVCAVWRAAKNKSRREMSETDGDIEDAYDNASDAPQYDK